MTPRRERLSAPAGERLLLIALGVVSAAVFLAALDQTMVVTVLPSILRDLRIPFTRLDQAAWIVTGYLLGYTVAMPLFGRIADVRGRRLTFLAGLTIFAVGSLLSVLAGSLELLVAARVIQAAGGGALVPIAMAAAGDLFPRQRVAFALGVIGAAAEAGGVLGPLYGASLAQLFGWRSVFLVNLPLSLLLGALTWWALGNVYSRGPLEPEPLEALPDQASLKLAAPKKAAVLAEDDGRRQSSRGRIDYPGAVLLGAALATLTIGLSGNAEAGRNALKVPWLVGSVIAFAAFLLLERRRADPLVRLGLFRSRPFAAANLANLLVGGALIVGMVEIPLLAYSLLARSPVGGGLLLMRLTVMIPVGAVLGGWLADRVGYRATGAAGFIAVAAGYLLIARWPLVPQEPGLTIDLGLTGLGFGLVVAPIGASVITSVGERWLATGSALVTVMRMVGMTIGLASLSTWGLRRFNVLMAGSSLPLRLPGMRQTQYDALVASYDALLKASLHTVYREFFFIAGGIAVLAVLPALLFPAKRKERAPHTMLPQ